MALELHDIEVAADHHLVAFYESEPELAITAGTYLGDALRAGASALAIATPGHQRAFLAELEAAGLRPDELAAEDRLVWLEADTTLASLRSGECVDAEAFRRTVGQAIARAARGGRPVRAYGEMVALLWEAGDVLGAVELERLWNDLRRELGFSLMCAYRRAGAFPGEHESALHEVCHLHTAVVAVPPGRAPERPARVFAAQCYPAERESPAAARHLVGSALAAVGHDGTHLQDALTVVTELATNAVVHARSAFSVAVRHQAEHVRVSVHDRSLAEPRPRHPDPLAPSGHGLQLVSALCERWGVEHSAHGKTVWADLRLDA